MVAARMMRHAKPSEVDNLGITFYKSGLASNRKSLQEPLLGPTGGCALYTRSLLQQVYQQSGYIFDPDYFCYAEDTDLALRALLLGYRPAYADTARVLHKGSLSSGGPQNTFIFYHGIRNSLYNLVKDIPLSILLRYAPWLLIMHGAIILRHTLKGQFLTTYRIYRDFFFGFRRMLKKRKVIMRSKTLSTAGLENYISPSFYESGYIRFALRELRMFRLRKTG